MRIVLRALGFILLLDELLLSMAAKPPNVHYDFVVKEANYTKLCSTKSILTVNGSFPGPTITVHKGDTISVTVHNKGRYGLTIHWHGVKQPRNPWSDGPENITQCPIQAGASFTYQVIFSDEEGTLWWHAHSDWTRATVHGAIIILPPRDKSYPFATPYAQQAIIIASWYKADVMAVYDEAVTTGGDPNASDAFTINGQPGALYDCSKGTTYRILVNYGKTYLFRIINAVLNEELFFGIAKHKITVVGTDGEYIKPIITDYIMISPGQTMDVLVTTNQTPSYYYMAASAFADATASFDNTTTTAILQYNASYTPPSTIPSPTLPSYTDREAAENFTSKLRSLASTEHPVCVPKDITTQMFISVSVNQELCPNASCSGPNGTRLSASLNNISFVTPTIDVLQAYYRSLKGHRGKKGSDNEIYTTDFPLKPPYFYNFTGDVGNNTMNPSLGTKVKLINYMEQVEIVFQGTNVMAPENHPMHLHGFSFYLVGTGSGNFNYKTSPKSYNLVDPPKVNTFGVPKNGWATIRFVADNPGVWFMHCHLERHATWGMNTVIIVKNGNGKNSSILPPPDNLPSCSKS
ncbi:laccase-15 [Ziziphus jujuba]|uniref:Laccase n=1 Tax=Ziziphus jujuba TaxID=326968 RepID=A0ABM3ILH3_ZIZJJ|nr:laccase-15 [Ziziphus jujuba]